MTHILDERIQIVSRARDFVYFTFVHVPRDDRHMGPRRPGEGLGRFARRRAWDAVDAARGAVGHSRVVESDGLRWRVRSGTDDDLAAYSVAEHEPWMADLLRVQAGGVFLDVGVHVGRWTLRAAAAGAHVVGLEPAARSRAGLRGNLELNGSGGVDALGVMRFAVGHGSVAVHPVAAWDRPGMLRLEQNPRWMGWTQTREGGGDVAAVPVDDLLAAHRPAIERLDVVKVDVEGAEGRVLAGMHETLRRFRPRLVVEMHDLAVNRPEVRDEVLRELERANYSWQKVAEQGLPWYLVATPRAG